MELEKGITRNGEGFAGVRWSILGQSYFPKAVCDSAFAFETNSDPGQFVPVHIHPTQDEFILVQEGELSLKLDGVWSVAKAGDLVRMPRRIPHGYFNKSDKATRALFWVSPAGRLEDLFRALDGLTDVPEVLRLSARHAQSLASHPDDRHAERNALHDGCDYADACWEMPESLSERAGIEIRLCSDGHVLCPAPSVPNPD